MNNQACQAHEWKINIKACKIWKAFIMEREVFITIGNFPWTYNYESFRVIRWFKVSKFTASTCRIFHMTRMKMGPFEVNDNIIFIPHRNTSFSLQIKYIWWISDPSNTVQSFKIRCWHYFPTLVLMKPDWIFTYEFFFQCLLTNNALQGIPHFSISLGKKKSVCIYITEHIQSCVSV